jgi:hypothetical protein
MTTATKARKPRPKPARRVHLYDGFPMLLEMTVGPVEFTYWLTPVPCDFGATFEVRKMLTDGGTVYHVHIDDEGHHSCDCPGGSYHGKCKHLSALLALVKSGKLALPEKKPAAATAHGCAVEPPAPEPVQFDDP